MWVAQPGTDTMALTRQQTLLLTLVLPCVLSGNITTSETMETNLTISHKILPSTQQSFTQGWNQSEGGITRATPINMCTFPFLNEEKCLECLGEDAFKPKEGVYCDATWDRVLCWGVTAANSTARLPCPPLRGLDPTKFGHKKCGPDGIWEGRFYGDQTYGAVGWTNYTECYTPEARRIYIKIFGQASSQAMKEIANSARIMEMVGLCLSLVSLTVSLFIFCYFRSLKCDRTRIHRHLFLAIIIHVTIQLVVHIDSFIAKGSGSEVGGSIAGEKGTIYNTPIVCEALKVVVEYTKTVMFVWMFIEGMYLHNMLVVSVFSNRPNFAFFYVLGWGSPVMLTLAWAITSGFLDNEQCWFTYTFQPFYWILDGPRAAIIAVNLIFLLNIIRVLVTKLRESHSNEAEQVRKAVKAAIVLLPLLGLNNFLAMVETPLDSSIKFGIWTYTSTFLISFQGFFISLLYCFLNGEVQQTFRFHWDRYQQRQGRYTSGRRRTSGTVSIFTSVTEVPTHQVRSHAMAVVNGHRNLRKQENGETCI